MSAILRSIQVAQSLRNLTRTPVYLGALKQCSPVTSVRKLPLYNTRFFGIQHKPVLTSQKLGYNKWLNQKLERLNTEGRDFGRISFLMVQDVISELQTYGSISETHALVILRCCGSLMPEELPADRTKLAHSVWNMLESRGVTFDLSHYNALLRVYVENEHDFAPGQFLEDLKKKGIEPNRVTYQRLIMRYAQLGDIEGATKILEIMKDLNLPINENIFHSLILGHARAGDLKNARDMVDVMQESGLLPSVDTYLALAVAQAERGDLDGVRSTIALSSEKEEALHVRDLMEVIYALAANGHTQHVPEIIKLMRKDWGYNQDCMNLIYRLLNAGCDDTAHVLYNSMEMPVDAHTEVNQGLFMVRHYILRDKPLSSILSLCEDLQGDSVHLLQRSLDVAVHRNLNLVYPLMDAILAKGSELRPHYFWPLLARCANNNDPKGVYDVLRNMKARGVPTTMLTMMDYALPALIHDPSLQLSSVVEKLEAVGLARPDAVNCIVRILVRREKLASAVEFLQRYRFRIVPSIRRDLAIATISTQDYKSAAVILGDVRVGQNPDSLPEESADDTEPVHAATIEDVTGMFLLDIVYRAGSAAADFDWVSLLSALKDRGLPVSPDLAVKLLHTMGSQATEQVKELLDTLASGTLARPTDLDRKTAPRYFSEMSPEQLEEKLETCKAQGQDPKPLLMQLLVSLTHSGDVEKAEAVLKELEETHMYPIRGSLRVLLMHMYYMNNLPERAFELFEKVKANEPDFIFNSKLIMRLAHLHVAAGRPEDAAVLLETEGKLRLAAENLPSETKNLHLDLLCNRILLPSAESGDVEMVSRLERAILDGRFSAPNRRLFSPIIRAYLVKGDLESAWASVIDCKKNFNFIPYRKVFAQELIQREDTNKLQQLVDMSTELYGESASLFDLACSFIGVGRPKEAKRVLETPGLRFSSKRIEEACQFYVRQKHSTTLEGLLAASTGVASMDRRPIYHQLLRAYINEENCDKALGLWTQSQEEDLALSDNFMHDLGSFLKQNNRPVPFTIPDLHVESEQDQQWQNRSAPVPVKREHPKLHEFRKLFLNEQLDEAVALHNEIIKEDDNSTIFPARDSLVLAVALSKAGRLQDTLDLIKATPTLSSANWSARRHPLLRNVLGQLAEQGDYDSIEDAINSVTRAENKRRLTRYLCIASWHNKQPERYFDRMHQLLDEASSPDEINKCAMSYSIEGFLYLLNRDPLLLSKVEDLASKLQSKGLTHGVGTLWAYHFIKQNMQEVEQLCETLGSSAPQPHFAVLHYCRDANDVATAENLLSYIKANRSHNWNSAAEVGTYNCIVDLLCAQNASKEALKVLEDALKDFKLENFKPNTLTSLADQLAALDIQFPYKLPVKDEAQRSEERSVLAE